MYIAMAATGLQSASRGMLCPMGCLGHHFTQFVAQLPKTGQTLFKDVPPPREHGPL